MPRSSKPRKAHRPKVIGRPILSGMADDLAMHPQAALTAIELGYGAEQHDHTLAAYLGMSLLAAEKARMEERVEAIRPGLEAVKAMRARHARTGRYGLSGEEMRDLRRAVTIADRMTSLLRTDQVAHAIAEVMAIAGFDEDDDSTPAPAEPVSPGGAA